MKLIAGALSAVLWAAALSGCATNSSDEDVTVYAASSLTDAFVAIGEAFEETNPQYRVHFNFAASSELAVQINERAPADVFASANEAQMQVVLDAGNAGAPAVFTRNELALAAPADSDVVTVFDDIAAPGAIIVAAAPDVPVGELFHRAMDALLTSGVRDQAFLDAVIANLASEESNVRAVLTRVELGEADAGFIYATDLAIAGDTVRRILMPAEARLSSAYPIVAIGDEPTEGATAFITFVLSGAGQAVLTSYGFSQP